jgi:N-acetylmuramoyl-L-alanine amidase
LARVAHTKSDIDLIARMIHAEAVGEGRLRSIRDVIFHVQGGNYSFEAVQKGSLFYRPARDVERRLARQVVKNWRQHPSKYALWYFNPYGSCPPTWYNQPFAGQYKQHCYYEPQANTCESAYRY